MPSTGATKMGLRISEPPTLRTSSPRRCSRWLATSISTIAEALSTQTVMIDAMVTGTWLSGP